MRDFWSGRKQNENTIEQTHKSTWIEVNHWVSLGFRRAYDSFVEFIIFMRSKLFILSGIDKFEEANNGKRLNNQNKTKQKTERKKVKCKSRGTHKKRCFNKLRVYISWKRKPKTWMQNRLKPWSIGRYRVEAMSLVERAPAHIVDLSLQLGNDIFTSSCYHYVNCSHFQSIPFESKFFTFHFDL